MASSSVSASPQQLPPPPRASAAKALDSLKEMEENYQKLAQELRASVALLTHLYNTAKEAYDRMKQPDLTEAQRSSAEVAANTAISQGFAHLAR
jgi:hypothetical protein